VTRNAESSPTGRNDPGATDPADGEVTRRPRPRAWVATSLVIVLIGVTCTVLAAGTVARNNGEQARQAAAAATTEIAANLTLAIERQTDLVVNAGAHIVSDPSATQSQFQEWTRSAQVFERYPQVVGIAEVVMVTQAQLAAFAGSVNAAPSGLLPPGTTFSVTPPGVRPFYCFPIRSQDRTGHLNTPADTDLCDSPIGSGLVDARASGQGAYLPYGSGASAAMVVGTPIYRAGAPMDSPQARQAAFVGWTGTQIRPGILLGNALRGHDNTALVFRYAHGSETASFAAGKVPAGAQRTTVNLHNGWSVMVLLPPGAGGELTDPNVLWVLAGGTLLSVLLGALVFVLGTSRSRALALVHVQTDELRHQALHDALTGLPNRALILDRIGQMLARSRRTSVPIAVLFLDLDNFKDINDTLGHRAGDDLLIAVARRLTGALRADDSVGRLGGDEFVVLTEGAALEDGAGTVARRILDAMTEPFPVAGSDTVLHVAASIGYVEGARPTPEELLQDADIALYQAKAAGKHCAVPFTPAMQAAVDDHRHLSVDLMAALDAGEFVLEYQPVVDLRIGTIIGVEALLRWNHPTRGVLAPTDFIDELEASGPILEVGAWVLNEACRQGARWHRLGHDLAVSVNVSAKQFEQERILDDIHTALGLSGFDPGSLILELTETVLMHDVEGAVERLDLLKSGGVRIAIDDFGTGYSSLAYLRRLPIDILKIDRSFVTPMTEDGEAEALVHTLAQLARILGLTTIAEGVESEALWMRLFGEGVDAGQGFLFSGPLTSLDLDHLLASPAGHWKVPAAAGA
jgi:diguanylate cyclase (GGDEF)-like protein